MRTIHRTTGELRWQLLKAAPIHDDHDQRVASVMIIEDITRERIAELRDRFMARASETLMSSIDYEETLRNVAWLAVPEIADWCAVELVDDRGTRQRLAVAHRDPSKLSSQNGCASSSPSELDPERGVGKVLRTGVSELYQHIPDDALVRAAINEEHLRLLRSVGFRSVLLTPLMARGRAFGVMTLVNAESMRRFDEDDRVFAEHVAARAGVAVDNARLATARRQTATRFSGACCRTSSHRSTGGASRRCTGPRGSPRRSRSAATSTTSTRARDDWIVLLGDVTGKGARPPRSPRWSRHGARFLSRYERSPSRILAGLNEALREQSDLWLCTAVCVRLGGERAVIASAGHPAALIVRDDGRVREIGAIGPILGAWATVDSSGSHRLDRSRRDAVPLHRRRDRHARASTSGSVCAGSSVLLSEHGGRPPEQLLSELEASSTASRSVSPRTTSRRWRYDRRRARAHRLTADAPGRGNPYPSSVLRKG